MKPLAHARMLVSALLIGTAAVHAQKVARRWDMTFSGFFKGGTAPLCIYANERNGQWLTSMGSSRRTFNRSYHCLDLSGAHRGRQDHRTSGPLPCG